MVVKHLRWQTGRTDKRTCSSRHPRHVAVPRRASCRQSLAYSPPGKLRPDEPERPRQPAELKPSYDPQQTWPPPRLLLLTSTTQEAFEKCWAHSPLRAAAPASEVEAIVQSLTNIAAAKIAAVDFNTMTSKMMSLDRPACFGHVCWGRSASQLTASNATAVLIGCKKSREYLI